MQDIYHDEGWEDLQMITKQEAIIWLEKSCPNFCQVGWSTKCHTTCHYADVTTGKCRIFHMERDGKIYG
jgi:hypothetical protein